MLKKILLINVLNYLLYLTILFVHIFAYQYVQLDGMLVIGSLAFTSLMIILLMFFWIEKYPVHKKALYMSIAVNFFNIIVFVHAFFAYALLTP